MGKFRNQILSHTFVAALLLIGGNAFAQSRMTVVEVGEYARMNSREIRSARLNLEAAEEAFQGIITLDDSRLSLNGGYTYTPSYTRPPTLADDPDDIIDDLVTESEAQSFTGGATLTIPIIPQLSLSAGANVTAPITTDTPAEEIESSVDGNLSITLSPFTPMRDGYRETEAHKKALVQLEYIEEETVQTARSAALALVSSQMNLSLAGQRYELEMAEEEVARKRYELGEQSFAELQTASTELSDARKRYLDAQRALLSGQKQLYQILGPEVGELEIAEASIEDLLGMIAELQRRLDDLANRDPMSLALKNTEIELAALYQQLSETPLYQPDLTLAANTNFPAENSEIPFSPIRGTISLSFSLQQINDEERNDIEEDIENKMLDVSTEILGLSLEVKMLQHSVSIAKEAMEVSTSDYENAETDLNETVFLHERGESTDTELWEAELNVLSAEIALFSSARDLYGALGDLMLLYVL